MKRLALVPLLALLALAASPSPFEWGPWGEVDATQQPVEQQTEWGATQPDHSLWVVNNTGCAWDADDSRFKGDTDGTLASGMTATGTTCLVADSTDHAVNVHINAPSPDLVVSISYPQGFSLQAVPTPLDRRYVYSLCVVGPDYDDMANNPDLQPIPNSGTAPNMFRPSVVGGIGVMTTVTFSVTNPTNRTVKTIHGVMRLRAETGLACDVEASDPRFVRVGTYPGPFFRYLPQ